jgi:hypothetical protein
VRNRRDVHRALLIGLPFVGGLVWLASLPPSAAPTAAHVRSAGTRAIAELYPGDIGIDRHPDVLFAEGFERAALSDVFRRWTDIRNASTMSLSADVPAGSGGSQSLDIPWTGGGVSDGGHLYKLLTPGVDDTLYVRYYIKYPTTGTYVHTGVWMGGSNPSSTWPNPQAGSKPQGNDRFIAGAEQNVGSGTGLFDHYDYWMNMRRSLDGKYWGNVLLNDRRVLARAGHWMCVEHMVKLNYPTTASNGEHAIWLDGIKVSHLGHGFPKGSWIGGRFTGTPTGEPFEGFRWRSDSNLKLNWIWLQTYAPGNPAGFRASLKFDHVVVASRHVGCLVPKPQPR